MNARTTRLLGMMLVWAVMCCVAEASLVTKNDTIDDIMLRYRIPCDGSVSTINLGDVAISLADAGAYTNMSATLTVDANAQNHCLFSCMELHWLQTIWHLSATDPATYKGSNPDVPSNGQIIDPPNGGWDYMYTDGSARTNPKPGYDWFIDDQPWYYSDTGEAAQYTIGEEYTIEDGPADRTDPEYVGFSTYLAVIVKDLCEDAAADCLEPNQMIVLGGFDWTTSNTDISIQSTFNGATTGDLAEIGLAMTNADFSGWTVYDNDTKVVCCIPEPATFVIWAALGAIFLIAPQLRRARVRA